MSDTFVTQPVIISDTVTFEVIAKANGVLWDITGGTVTLTLTDPSGESTNYLATITDPTNGTAEYTIADTVIDSAGVWKFTWTIVVSGIKMITKEEKLFVYAQ